MKPLRWILPVLLVVAAGHATAPQPLSDLDQVPVLVKRVAPEYPDSLRMSGYKGRVVVAFVIDPQGNVVRASVTESSHPDFEAPAVEAVLQTKWTPGIKAGHAVYVQKTVVMTFGPREHSINPRFEFEGGGKDPWQIPHRAPPGVPPEFAYDQPPRPLVTAAPVYPFEQLRAKTRGSATVAFSVDPDGNTHLLKLEGASAPDFGAATCAMILAWKFAPARQGGKPCWAYLRKEERFAWYDPDSRISASAERLLAALAANPSPIVTSAARLDEPIRCRFGPRPIVPEGIAHQPARAVIEFLVDHAGHAQLPRVVSASDPDFGWAAATAVARWQFTPPVSQGRPVDVKVSLPVIYSPALEAVRGS